MTRRTTFAALLLAAGASSAGEEKKQVSGFDWRTDSAVKIAIERKEIRLGIQGREPKDGIPAIWNPEALPAAEATWLPPEERVLGVVMGKEARAYPLKVLNVHEMVNDVLGGRPIAPNY